MKWLFTRQIVCSDTLTYVGRHVNQMLVSVDCENPSIIVRVWIDSTAVHPVPSEKSFGVDCSAEFSIADPMNTFECLRTLSLYSIEEQLIRARFDRHSSSLPAVHRQLLLYRQPIRWFVSHNRNSAVRLWYDFDHFSTTMYYVLNDSAILYLCDLMSDQMVSDMKKRKKNCQIELAEKANIKAYLMTVTILLFRYFTPILTVAATLL